MSDLDTLAHVFLRRCRADASEALTRGDHDAATRAVMARDGFLEEHPQYDDGTYRAVVGPVEDRP